MRQRIEFPGGTEPGNAGHGVRSSPRVADRFDIVRLLKQGNGVSTFLAVDAAQPRPGNRVIIKTFDVDALQADQQARFVLKSEHLFVAQHIREMRLSHQGNDEAADLVGNGMSMGVMERDFPVDAAQPGLP